MSPVIGKATLVGEGGGARGYARACCSMPYGRAVEQIPQAVQVDGVC